MDHDVLLGLPHSPAKPDIDELRVFLVSRQVYCLADDENPNDLVALVDGVIPPAIGWNRTIFWYEPLGEIMAVDGVTVIATQDGYVYKADSVPFDIKSVLDRDMTEAPDSGVSIGDTFIVGQGATGDWAGYDDYKTIYTERGWNMVSPVIGDWILVEDEGGFVRYTEDGEWVLGPGQRAFEDDSIPVSAIINAARTSFIVENQTTNAPPVSPLKGIAYIIGGSPTGAWAGKAKQIAVCEVDGEWSYYAPATGWQAFDRAQNVTFRYSGTAWLSAAGTIVFTETVLTVGSGSGTAVNGAGYTYSPTVAPATTDARRTDDVTITRIANRIGAELRFQYCASPNGGGTIAAIALFRDAEVDAIDWIFHDAEDMPINALFIVTAADVTAHVYKVALMASGAQAGTPSRRRFIIEELA